MKRTMICAGILLAMATGAQAQDLSFGFDASVGMWANEDGGSGISSNRGIDGKDQRMTGRAALSAAMDFGTFVGQLDLKYQGLGSADPNLDDDDATKVMRDVTLRAFRDFGTVRAGLFLGKGRHDDYGDSDEPMGYDFYGLDLSAATSFGSVFGQIGRFDSFDEYDEGTQDGSFIRAGASTKIGADYTLSGALSLGRGLKYASEPARIQGIELSVERPIAGTPYTVYASYDYTRIYYTQGGGKSGDTFKTAWIGMKIDFGSPAKRGGKLPDFGQWVAYNANEIE